MIERSYHRFLDVFRGLLEAQPFLMGARPGASDFACYGQLTQLATFDPTPMALTLERAPRVYAWIDLVDDLSGLEVDGSGWIERGDLELRLGGLLAEVGRVYAPYLVANSEALVAGVDEVAMVIDGSRWVQRPFPYQGKCLRWLREQREALSEADRGALDGLLAGTGCEVLFS